MFLAAGASSAQARPGCHTSACTERVAMHQCAQTRPVPCLQRAAIHWRVSFALLRAIAYCESTLNPLARNPSGSTGLMQFMRGTFLGTPYRARDWLRAKWSALAGAWLLRAAGTDPWVSSRPCWG